MFCPNCNNKIPDGSNICPLCYANLAGVKQQAQETRPERQDGVAQEAPRPRASKKPAAYTKGSRGTKRSADRTPMIIAFGLIVILVIIIAMIIRSMFGAGTPGAVSTPGERALHAAVMAAVCTIAANGLLGEKQENPGAAGA